MPPPKLFISTGIKEKRMHYHRRVCQDEANFKCDQCDERFKSRVHMMHHKNRHHVFLNCKHCGIEVSKGNMRSHVLHQHTAQADMPFKCELCPKGFVDRGKYQDHMNTHTGERPYSCDYCSNTFSNNSNKFKHIRESHHDEYQKRKAKRLAKL